MTEISQVREFAQRVVENVECVIVDKHATVEMAVVGLLSQGHLLIEDVPGVGKTMLARSLARSIGCSFGRVQFTPDMLPSDVTGVSIFNQMTQEFEFRPGPVMSQIVLVDEINRATPKTQAALLEAMEERQITVDGKTHPLPRPFMVLATQNSIEYEGTFPLPEAQLDRFLLRISVGYPSPTKEIDILDQQQFHHPMEDLEPVVSLEEVLAAQEAIKSIYVSPAVKQYIVALINQTRRHDDVYLGASPRGSLALYRTGQALAAVCGREFVLPDDVKRLAMPVLAHRIIVSPGAQLRDLSSASVLEGILKELPIPEGDVEAMGRQRPAGMPSG